MQQFHVIIFIAISRKDFSYSAHANIKACQSQWDFCITTVSNRTQP